MKQRVIVGDWTSQVNDLLSKKLVLQHLVVDGQLTRDDVLMFEAVFQPLQDFLFYAKDRDGRWISCNMASLRLLKMSHINEVLGTREIDFFPPKIADAIRLDDLVILEQGKTIINRIEFIPNADRVLMWVATNKQPIFDADDNIIGLIGITRPIPDEETLPQQFEYFRKAIAYIGANIDSTIRMGDLAAELRLSESQFRRKFRSQFGTSPQDFILRTRLQAAAQALSAEDISISEIAANCGFSDQSYFTRQFRRFFGETPKVYRSRCSPNLSS